MKVIGGKKAYFMSLNINKLKHNIDVMHVENNVCDNLLGTFLDDEKSKDTTNARNNLTSMGVRTILWIYEDDSGKLIKLHAPYVLTSAQKKTVLPICKRSNTS